MMTAHADTRAKQVRLQECREDLATTEKLFRASKSKVYREAINKLRLILIMEQHNLDPEISWGWESNENAI